MGWDERVREEKTRIKVFVPFVSKYKTHQSQSLFSSSYGNHGPIQGMGNLCGKGTASVNHHSTQKGLRVSIPFDSYRQRKGGTTTPSEDSGGSGKDSYRRQISQAESAAAGEVTGKGMVPNVKVFTLAELRRATSNFGRDTVLGEGGFGRVFKGWIDPKTYAPTKRGVGIPVAVKKSSPDSDQGLREWQAEVKFLGKFSHPNLVKLMGFCWEERQYLLVYEYLQKGSLDNHLFRRGVEPLSWEVRLRIAIGAARGLDFLHTSENSVIYRDFKSSNILLDAEYNAKLSDFGLAKLGPPEGDSHVTTQVIGTYGYAAPEYVATGHLYLKSDVFGFGVVLLELLTGLKAQDNLRIPAEANLVEWAKPYLHDRKKLRKIMDSRLEGQYSIKGAALIAQIILQCLEGDPKNRPGMDQVLAVLEQPLSISIDDTPKDTKLTKRVGSSPSHSPQYHRHDIKRSPLDDGGSGPSRISEPQPPAPRP